MPVITDVMLIHRPGGGMLHVQLGRSILTRVKKAVVTGEVQSEGDLEAGNWALEIFIQWNLGLRSPD